MRYRKTAAIPARLETGRRRFERWRRTRKGHSRIPDPLWTSAVKLAGAYGLCRTARTLGLDYNALKRRVASTRPGDSLGPKTVGAKAARQETATAFVELVPPQRAGLPECIVELENPRGAKMRIHVKGNQTPDVVTAVSRVLFGVAP
jgi:hypothetical protein